VGAFSPTVIDAKVLTCHKQPSDLSFIPMQWKPPETFESIYYPATGWHVGAEPMAGSFFIDDV
jgi:hypothetical protein